MPTNPRLTAAITFTVSLFLSGMSTAQCPDQHQLFNSAGAGSVACPCFVPGEEAGATFTIPADHLPIEILQVGIGWGSQFGGAPQTLEESINIYEAGLPNPGGRIFSLEGPLMTDGFINQFDLEPLPGEIMVNSTAVSVTLTFLNQNAGNIFAPSIVHGGAGCSPGQNLVYASPGGWADACLLGVTGDWVVELVYCAKGDVSGVSDEEFMLTNGPAVVQLHEPYPNPFNPRTTIQYELPATTRARLTVHAIDGRRVATLVDDEMTRGAHATTWHGQDDTGRAVPSGIYFMRLEAGGINLSKRIVLLK